MDNKQIKNYKSVGLLGMYNGEPLVCNKIIALSYDGKTADSLVSEIKQRGGILASEALIMRVDITNDNDVSDKFIISFSDSNYDAIIKCRSCKDYRKDEDIIVARLSDDCDTRVFNVYINDKIAGLPNDNSSTWFFIAKKPESSDKSLSVTCYDEVYKTPIISEAEFMWDSITEKDIGHYVMYATGVDKYLNAPKILKET